MAQVFSPNLAQNFPFRVQIALPYQARPAVSLQSPTDLALRILKDCSATFPPTPPN